MIPRKTGQIPLPATTWLSSRQKTGFKAPWQVFKATEQAFKVLRRKAALLCALTQFLISSPSLADEGGASLYLPGSFASMAAVPGAPGWSTSLTYYHSTATLQNVSEEADLAYGSVNYAFATPVLGGQLTLSLFGAFGGMSVDIADTRKDSRLGVMDATPAAAVRWNAGVNNYMVYTLANVPVGTYDVSRLANFSIEHWGQDAGFGYTYFNQDTGYEFSAVAGATYNFENPQTNYRNGIDAHIDFAASRFISNTFQIGLAGYFYQQLTSDSGSGAIFGDYRSKVAALGPQVGYIFPLGQEQGYLNLRAYREFAAGNRPSGWNLWLTLSISPQGP